jgi:hypothetical protein
MFSEQKLLVGVIHLPPLPGYPESPGMDAVVVKALADLRALEIGPVEAILVENENDKPHRVAAARETIAAMTRVTAELVAAARHAKVGVEILLNDPMASLAVAHMADASFIRTDYFVDPMERPEHGGRMDIDPESLMRYRTAIGADAVLVLADIQVKYARMLEPRTLRRSAELARERGADAIVVTGTVTGEPPSLEQIQQAQEGADKTPVLIGSGLDASNAPALLAAADGAIVGTSLKRGDAVDADKVKELVDARRLCR